MFHKIIVSEPWDFTNIYGTNIITGKIIDIINERMLIFKSSDLIALQGVENKYFALFPRLKEDNFSKESLESSIEVNVYILTSTYCDGMNINDIICNSVFVIIGDIMKL